MTGTCETIALSGPLDKIRAHYQQDKGISRITYYREDKSKAYGKIGERMVEWDMSNSLPLVGIYGNVSQDRINRLGFITLNTKCQAFIESSPEEVDEEEDQGETAPEEEKSVDEPVAVNIENSDEVVYEETTEIPTPIEADISDQLERETPESRYSSTAKIFILVGSVTLLAICALTIF